MVPTFNERTNIPLLLARLRRTLDGIALGEIAAWISDYNPKWLVAGLAGALMGAVWNYVVSAAFVWRAR